VPYLCSLMSPLGRHCERDAVVSDTSLAMILFLQVYDATQYEKMVVASRQWVCYEPRMLFGNKCR
jgi:hypothetical protein